MKNKFCRTLLFVLAAAVVAILAVGLVACNKATLQKITVENPIVEFNVGDQFSVGESFKVTAHYSDGSTADVTSDVQIKYESGFDMNVAGEYMVTIVYENKKEVYTINVGSFENILRKIELDTANVKKTYSIGDEISYDGIKVNCTYENAQGNLINSTYLSLRPFAVTVNGSSPLSDGIFMALGEYTVTVSKGGISDSYNVSADSVDISSVQGAIFTGNAFKTNVISGSASTSESVHGKPSVDSFEYDYEFGDNYTYINQKLPQSDSAQYHMSIDEQGLFCAKFRDQNLEFDSNLQAARMQGVPFYLWYFRGQPYGVENLLIELYKNAKTCSNNDLKETVDESGREYSFTFSGLKFLGSVSDYYETTVSFTLAEDYSIKTLQYTQDYWENNLALKDKDDYSPTFITDENTGNTTPNTGYTLRVCVSANQTSGERTKTNPYSRDMFVFKSFDLVYNDEILGDNGVIDCDINQTKTLTVSIENIYPITASFQQDALYFDYEGGFQGAQAMLNIPDELTAYRRDNSILITLKCGGTWTLILSTSNGLKKTLTINAIGYAPKTMTGQIGNSNTQEFYPADSKTVAVGSDIYFYGMVGSGDDSRQTYEITSDNKQYATVQSTIFGAKNCFKFSATKEGIYTVVVSSQSAPSVQCAFTFTVNEMPDYENILQGSYTVTDYDGNIYLVEFSPQNSDGNFDGSVRITVTPTDDNDTPIPSEAVSQMLEYSVVLGEQTIKLTHLSGENLGVILAVDADGKLTLEDRYETVYQLIPM